MQHGQRTVTLFDFFICDYTGDDDDDDESDSEYVTTDELPVVSCSLQQGLKQSVCVCVGVSVVQGGAGCSGVVANISNRSALVRKTSGLINSRGLTGESSQVGVVLEINLHRKC